MDILLNFQNKFMARCLGDALSSFLDVDCDQDNFCWGESLKIKILVDISKPLRRGIWIDPRVVKIISRCKLSMKDFLIFVMVAFESVMW